jgi:AraC-like DNA-binding protein/ligand-binding sensor protein
MKDFNLLQSTVKWLLKNRKFHICIHDLSGILHQNSSIQIPKQYTIHSCTFCEHAKATSSGLRFCLKCKELSLKKALNHKDLFIGQCYLGITEIVKPIFHNNKPLCVIYLGNIVLNEHKRSIVDKIKKISYLTGADSNKLIRALSTTEHITESTLSEYQEIVEIIGNCITQSITEDTKLHRKNISTLPSYRNTNHWIIEHIQNYILTYYNRDLQLSQLAKLYFLNAEYLCRLFKKETGTNFSDYVNTVRINKAKHLLISTDYKIVDISNEVGYQNATYFNKLFKRYTGNTPTDFRSMSSNTHK